MVQKEIYAASDQQSSEWVEAVRCLTTCPVRVGGVLAVNGNRRYLSSIPAITLRQTGTCRSGRRLAKYLFFCCPARFGDSFLTWRLSWFFAPGSAGDISTSPRPERISNHRAETASADRSKLGQPIWHRREHHWASFRRASSLRGACFLRRSGPGRPPPAGNGRNARTAKTVNWPVPARLCSAAGSLGRSPASIPQGQVWEGDARACATPGYREPAPGTAQHRQRSSAQTALGRSTSR